MQNSDVVTHDEASEFQIMVACECYSDQGHVRDALAQLSDEVTISVQFGSVVRVRQTRKQMFGEADWYPTAQES